jgi:hypothetical protein
MNTTESNKLKACVSCGNRIAKSATKCPHCGKAYTSKPLVFFLIFLGLLALLVFVWVPYRAMNADIDKAAEKRKAMKPVAR